MPLKPASWSTRNIYWQAYFQDPVRPGDGIFFYTYLNPMFQVCINGSFRPADQPVFQAANRGYRYGDGLFETMKISGGKILLEEAHIDRLFSGMRTMQMKSPAHWSPERIREQVLACCRRNGHEQLARVRLSVYRGNGGLYEEEGETGYLIESWPLEKSMNTLNENGLVTDIFPAARKVIDAFASLKTASFLPYALAARYAREQQLNDCFILNSEGNLADSTIANIFLVSGDRVRTPSLEQGCVAGVMRKHLLDSMKRDGMVVQETEISIGDLLEADELFLTNAIRGILRVGRFREKTYQTGISARLHARYIKPFFD